LIDHYFTDAHETGSDVVRQVVVFRLEPLNDVQDGPPRAPSTRPSNPQVAAIAVEEHNTERSFVTRDREPHELERRVLYTDHWNATSLDLIEAKATVSRSLCGPPWVSCWTIDASLMPPR
jgi:hypothetical protein